MLDFFKTLVAAGVPGLAYSDLLAMLVNPVIGPKGGKILPQGKVVNLNKIAPGRP